MDCINIATAIYIWFRRLEDGGHCYFAAAKQAHADRRFLRCRRIARTVYWDTLKVLNTRHFEQIFLLFHMILPQFISFHLIPEIGTSHINQQPASRPIPLYTPSTPITPSHPPQHRFRPPSLHPRAPQPTIPPYPPTNALQLPRPPTPGRRRTHSRAGSSGPQRCWRRRPSQDCARRLVRRSPRSP